jgi:flagellar basal-body rod modification protein FlgD
MSNTALPGMLGKSAKATASSFSFDGENNVPVGYTLNGAAISAQMVVKNSSGGVVRTIDLTGADLKSGDHKLKWDGKNNNGETLASGNYNIEVNAVRSPTSTYKADTFIYGAVQAVRFKNEGTMIVINGNEISLKDIINLEMN